MFMIIHDKIRKYWPKIRKKELEKKQEFVADLLSDNQKQILKSALDLILEQLKGERITLFKKGKKVTFAVWKKTIIDSKTEYVRNTQLEIYELKKILNID